MTILANAIALPHGDAASFSRRIIKRPGPPPSKQPRPRPPAVPMSRPPQPPPIYKTQESATDSQDSARRPGTLVTVFVSAAVAISLFGILVCGLLALAKHHGYFADHAAPADNRQSPNSADKDIPPTIINVFKPSQQAASRDRAFEQDAPTVEESLAAASLLEDRYYELQTDDEGRVVGARMSPDDQNKRFGPGIDEVEALTKLPHLQRLDLRNTLASVAVPIANRHPSVEVLVLEQQSDTNSLLKLQRIQELHLANSTVDAVKLSRRGIRVVEASR